MTKAASASRRGSPFILRRVIRGHSGQPPVSPSSGRPAAGFAIPCVGRARHEAQAVVDVPRTAGNPNVTSLSPPPPWPASERHGLQGAWKRQSRTWLSGHSTFCARANRAGTWAATPPQLLCFRIGILHPRPVEKPAHSTRNGLRSPGVPPCGPGDKTSGTKRSFYTTSAHR